MMINPQLPFQSLPVNMSGMDYFVGDIHGQFSKLHEALLSSGFRFEVDRLICVGDLIDRGDQSIWAEKWLDMPYFYSVRGNHEDLYLQWYSLRDNKANQQAFEDEMYFPNGGRWVKDVDDATHHRLAKAFLQLPFMLTVPSSSGKLVGAVHAGLPDGASWPQLIGEELTPSRVEDMIWSRNRLMYQLKDKRAQRVWDDGVIPGLDAVVCGHIIVNQITWAGKFCYIETGGWKKNGHFSIIPMTQLLEMAQYKGI